MKLNVITSLRKTGEERLFTAAATSNISLLDYWSWAHSDLIVNTERGKLAEFIVASALGVHNTLNSAWDSFDLMYMGKGIEVKSAAYLQSWQQAKESYIEFGIRPTRGLVGDTGTYQSEIKRQADAYVFCHLKHKDKLTINPLDLDQWHFYIVPTALLNKKVPVQKHIALSFFAKNGIAPCEYSKIRTHVERALQI